MIMNRVRTCIAILAIDLAFALPCTAQIFKPTPTVYPSGGGAQWVVMADVNKDGKPDAVVANGGSVAVLLGNGDGTFQAATLYPVTTEDADAVAVADLNGDGWPDLVVGSDGGEAVLRSLSVLLNNGDGTFQPAVGYSSAGFDIRSVAVADVNGDGKPDLVAANQVSCGRCLSSSVAVLLGNGDGTFLPAVTYPLRGGSNAQSVVAADLNGDGKPDLVVADGVTTDILLNKGDGTFQDLADQSGETPAGFVMVGDVNGDGIPDVVVTTALNSVGIKLGNGDGTFRPAVVYGTPGLCPVSVAIGDFNGDGTPDLVVSSAPLACGYGTNQSGKTGVLLNNGDGTFQTPVITYSTGGLNAYSVAVADVNQDGKPDLVVADGCDGYNIKCPGGGGVAISLGLPAETTTTITTSGSPSTFGQPVTFTATITAAYGPIADGAIVTFYNNSTQIGTATTTKGTATFTISSLKVGTHTIKATYPSSAYFKKSSGTVTQVVN